MNKKFVSLVICSFVLFFLVSCSSKEKPGLTEEYPNRSMKISIYNDLPSSVGDITIQHKPRFDLPVNFIEGLADKTEYETPSNKWFDTGFSISAGKHLPNDEVSIRLEGDYHNQKIRYQLTERDADLNKIDTIKEEITINHTFIAKLPDKEGSLYLLSAEILDHDGTVQDTLLSLVEIPHQSINAKLYTDKEKYHRNQTITLNLENFGPTNLFFGKEYSIEQFDNGEWKILGLLMEFESIGLILAPNDIYKQTINLPEIPIGIYRLIKEINGEGTQVKAMFAASFEVIE